MKKLSYVFWITAVLLSDVMCAVVAANYRDLWWGARYEYWSAPTSAAFLYAIPFLAGIAASVALAIVFGRKAGK